MSRRVEDWRKLLDGGGKGGGGGSFPIAAYSEFMPPPRIGRKPYGTWSLGSLSEAKPRHWQVTAREELHYLRPGLANIATQLINDLVAVAQGNASHHIGAAHLEGNPYWPGALADAAKSLRHERFTVLSPLALSRTQDDKGRVRWTLFGGSHDGPSAGFWRSFHGADGAELPAAKGRRKLAKLLGEVTGDPAFADNDLRRAGLRALPDLRDPEFPSWHAVAAPSWLKDIFLPESGALDGVRYLLTFRPFSKLPEPVQAAYIAGKLHILPYPGSLVFWGSPHFRKLDAALPGAIQIPLLQSIVRHDGNNGIRVLQSGWMFERGPNAKEHGAHLGPLRNGFRRSNRWERIERNDDTSGAVREHGIQKVLFSAHPDDVSLYDKPMARNAQVWSDRFEPLLDGPSAGGKDLQRMLKLLEGGGSFGYRMFYPPMIIGETPVFWHRPLVAFRDPKSGKTVNNGVDFTGHLTAGGAEFWPDIALPGEADPPLPAAKPAQAVARAHADLNLRKLANAQMLLGKKKLPQSFARSLLTADKDFGFGEWLEHARKANAATPRLASALAKLETITAAEKLKPSQAHTFARTATRAYEEDYWKTIAFLSAGDYATKNNADVVVDPVTLRHRDKRNRDLDPLGDYLIGYYRKAIAAAGMDGKALSGEHRFQWRTDFDFAWMGGWNANSQGDPAERNIICVIPGRNRKEAVILGDHYDTAYMEDIYGYGEYKGDHARVAAAGADDNNSATATLMLAAPIFLEMSKRGELECDVWMVHLTGEEFPSDCLGARNLSQSLIEGSLKLGLGGGKTADLSGTRVRGVYVMDMIAHNNDRNRDIFQMAPGTDPQSMWLAFQAQRAAELWRLGAETWNETPERRKAAKRGKRSKDPATVPALAKHLAPLGEVRPAFDPKSTLFNTDGQVFSDAGVPVVLFMENYDIERQGYHDTHDTMENIDLDYGSAVAAICIEAAARAANETPPDFEAIRKRAMGG